MSKSLTNKSLLKKKLYGLKMVEGSLLDQHINVFDQFISDLKRVDLRIEEEDMTLILLNTLPESYDNLVTTMMWGKRNPRIGEDHKCLTIFQSKEESQ